MIMILNMALYFTFAFLLLPFALVIFTRTSNFEPLSSYNDPMLCARMNSSRWSHMKKILLSLLAVLVLGAPLCAQTLDEVLAKNYQARGGLDKLKALAGWKLSGKIVVPAQGLDLPVAIWQKAPDKMRVETDLPGQKDRPGLRRPEGLVDHALPFRGRPGDAGRSRPGCSRSRPMFENPLVVLQGEGLQAGAAGQRRAGRQAGVQAEAGQGGRQGNIFITWTPAAASS